MAQQIINVGTTPDDGRGDKLRPAFQKVNANFTELYARGGSGGGGGGGGGGRPLLPADTTFYVDNATGDDTNDGLTPATAFATFLHAWNVACSYDLNRSVAPIQLQTTGADYVGIGVYLGGDTTAAPFNGQLVVQGDALDTTAVTLKASPLAGACLGIYAFTYPVTVRNLTLSDGGIEGASLIQAGYLVAITLENVNYKFVGTSGSFGIYTFLGGTVNYNNSASTRITGNFSNFAQADIFSSIYISALNPNFTAPSTISGAFLQANVNGSIHYSVTAITGVVTGPKVAIQPGGGIFTNDGASTFIPGNTLGTIEFSGLLNKEMGAIQKAGLPANTDIAQSTWAVFKDTSGGGVYVAYNDAGTIKKVALT